MTDEEWRRLTLRLNVSDEARAEIEAELDLYRRFATKAEPPATVQRQLDEVALSHPIVLSETLTSGSCGVNEKSIAFCL